MANTTQGAVAQEQALVPTFRAAIGGIEQTCVDARFLHAYLQSQYHFTDWMNTRLQKYGFEAGADYELVSEKTEIKAQGGFSGNSEKPSKGGRPAKDYRLTLDMAKELSMVENNERGRDARRYFIAMERQALGMQATPAARPQPQHAAREQLNAADMQNLKRLIWVLADRMRQKEVWAQAIWFHLRRALNNPAPQPFYVDQLQDLQCEMASVLVVAVQVQDLIARVEQDAARRIFRRGELASVVIQSLATNSQRDLDRLQSSIRSGCSWLKNDLQSLLQRTQPNMGVQYHTEEQPDFFGV